MDWLDEKLKERVRNVFKKDYKRELSNEEVVTIAVNLADFMETYIKFKLRKKNEKSKQ